MKIKVVKPSKRQTDPPDMMCPFFVDCPADAAKKA
jgi:hypothetical protein